MDGLPEDLQQLKRFHTHLGPYVVIGYRMGSIARERLGGNMQAIIFSSPRPPLSCMLDGIQFSSGCTLGKANLIIKNSERQKGRFITDNEEICISLKFAIREKMNREMTKENEEDLALYVYEADEDELFIISKQQVYNTDRLLKL